MTDHDLEDFLIRCNFGEPIFEDTFRAGADEAMDVLENLDDEGVGIRWMKSHVRTEADGAVVGTTCQYQTEDEAALREHAERTGLPIARIDRHEKTLKNT